MLFYQVTLIVCSLLVVTLADHELDQLLDTFWADAERGLQSPDYGKTWTYIADGNGYPHKISLIQPRETRMAVLNANVYYRLYTGPGEHQLGQTLEDLPKEFSKFDPNKDTVFLIHGWESSDKSDSVVEIRKAYIETNLPVNVITVDWNELAIKNYVEVINAAQYVGKAIAQVIDLMHDQMGLDLDKVRLVGHSLGAHVAGFAGANVVSGKVGQITGLDPAGPGFDSKTDERRLNKNDAKFVDIIHTSAFLGMKEAIGHVDFYPNGGDMQPGCLFRKLSLKAIACSHCKAPQYFAESIRNNNFYGYQCIYYGNEDCVKSYEAMGQFVSKNARGVYYVDVRGTSPYSIGLN